MRFAVFPLLILLVATPVAAARQSLGIFSLWGAFREDRPQRCFAIARPTHAPRAEGWQPFATISWWPDRQVRGQLHVRLSRQKRPGSAVLLRVDDRTFQLAGGGVNAWAPSPQVDAEIVRAIRTGVGMRIETRSVRGARVREYYQLRGAATAIDAAAISCAAPR